MSLFYFTFGQRYRHEPHPTVGHLAHPDGWFTVEADDEIRARLKMIEACGQHWSGCYDKEPDRQLYKLGEIIKI